MPRYRVLSPRPVARPLAWAAVALAAIACLLLVPASPAAADTGLEVTTPADGRYVPGGPTPLLVTISADRAVSGTLTATFDQFRVGAVDVEVAGGSTKEVVLIANLPPWVGAGVVAFETGDESDEATARVTLTAAGGDELVAVLPELAGRDLPAVAELTPELGVARLFALDVGLLDSGSDVLSPFSQLMTTGADLEALDPARLSAIEHWVGANGGVLVVDEPPGTALPFELTIGDASTDGGDGAIPFGVGQVRFTDGVAGDGRYDGLLGPTQSRAADDFPWSGWGSAPSTMQLARDAGVRVPAIGSILAILGIYTAIAGPALWLGLRRSRREPLLWVIAPVLALVTTLGVYGFGRALREDASTAHATLRADLPTLEIVSTQVLVTSPNGGDEGITLPDGWRPTMTSSEQWFEGPFGPTAGPQATLHGSDLIADLPPGGISVIGAEVTRAATDPSWQFDLVLDGDTLTGSIINLSGHDLEEVYVASGQGFSRISHVDAGASAEVTLRDVDAPPITSDRLMEQLFNSDPWTGNDGAVNPGVLTEWLNRRPLLRAPGYVLAVGWTRAEEGPLETTRGATVESGRTAFLSVNRVVSADGSPQAGIEFLRGQTSTRLIDRPGPNQCGDFAITARITPPPLDADDEPVLEMSRRTVAALDVWDGREWIAAGVGEATVDGLVIGLPAAAMDDGPLYVRFQMSCEFWGVAAPFPVLRAATADDGKILALGRLDEAVASEGDADADEPEDAAALQPAPAIPRPRGAVATTVVID